MKELSTEEKAKAYDNIIEKATKMHNENCEACQMCIEELIPELAEFEDDRIRKAISQCVFDMRGQFEKLYSVHHKDALAWLEKQGEHANFRDKIQVGDKVTRNKDGVLVNLSQLKRVAKPKQKPDDVDYNPFDDFRKSDSEINPSEFDTRLQNLIDQFDSLPKEELIGSLSFWMNVVQNDGTYKSDEKQGEQKPKYRVGDIIKYNQKQNTIIGIDINNHCYDLDNDECVDFDTL